MVTTRVRTSLSVAGGPEAPIRRSARPACCPRYAVEDIDLCDVVIKKGDAILLAFGAAGRDPAVHGDSACEFDAGRESTDHLAFGHGVHFCLGAPLGRMEADIALRALFGAFPDLALAVPESALVPQASFIAHGYQQLPVILRPAEVAAAV
ncbi:cytochrome P450 [Streptomyces sp. NBC_00385]|uniref:cytochrome P450 n=1 Tax=Streptomyces sp. NBC_00385 TaxID=2975733 RepID=UPI002DDBB67F|nr:cytochrome P450 [Streptomyces sp. NBC_00385]